MAKNVSLGLAAAGIIGLIISAVIWQTTTTYLQPFINGKPFQDQTVITAIVENSIHNPDVQYILRTQVMLYLKSPEGKAKLIELMKSPEMIRVMAENLQSPELRPAVIQLMRDPSFRQTLLSIVHEAPEMKTLRILESAIEWNDPPPASDGFRNE